MKKDLTREIIKHVYFLLGVGTNNELGFIEKITTDKFLIAKKMAFEVDGKKIEKNIWATEAKVGESSLKIMIADISDDEVAEYAAIVKLDNLVPYGIRLAYDSEDYGDICFNPDDNNWIDANIMLQAKFLSGMEQVASIFVDWKKLESYEDLHKSLVGFLNAKN